jgi:hypothetical protein
MITPRRAPVEEELIALIREDPMGRGTLGRQRLRRQIPYWRHVCGIIASHCPRGARLLSLEAESGLLEILLKREYGFESLTVASSRPAPALTRRLAALEIRTVVCRVDRESIPEQDEAFGGVLMPRVRGHLGSDLPRALAECRRVLTPGGTLLVGTSRLAEFGDPGCRRGRSGMAWWRERTALLMGDLREGEATGEPTVRELSRLLGEAGFLIEKVRVGSGRLRIRPWVLGDLWPGGEREMYFIARRP